MSDFFLYRIGAMRVVLTSFLVSRARLRLGLFVLEGGSVEFLVFFANFLVFVKMVYGVLLISLSFGFQMAGGH